MAYSHANLQNAQQSNNLSPCFWVNRSGSVSASSASLLIRLPTPRQAKASRPCRTLTQNNFHSPPPSFLFPPILSQPLTSTLCVNLCVIFSSFSLFLFLACVYNTHTSRWKVRNMRYVRFVCVYFFYCPFHFFLVVLFRGSVAPKNGDRGRGLMSAGDIESEINRKGGLFYFLLAQWRWKAWVQMIFFKFF